MGQVLPPLEYPVKPSLEYLTKKYGTTPNQPNPALQHLGKS